MTDQGTPSDFGAGFPLGSLGAPPAAARLGTSVRDRSVEALMALAGERAWDDFGIAEVASRAGVTLGEFREHFVSKGAILAAFSRSIDKIVLDGTGQELAGESGKERLFDVLMRRLDALEPYRNGLEGIRDWTRQSPLAGAALNRVAVNSMRFMLTAAGIDTEGSVGAVKVQGLVLAWARVLDTWFRDPDSGLPRTMAALDKELLRGERVVARVEDLHRLTSPLRTLARGVFNSRRSWRDGGRDSGSTGERWSRGGRATPDISDEPLRPVL